jgi:predicted RNA methylase
VNIARYLEGIPKLHTWDNGATWNTSGMDAPYLRRLFDFLQTNRCRRIIETGAGNSTLICLLAGATRVVSIAPDPDLLRRIIEFCEENEINHAALEQHAAASQWLLPEFATAAPADFDFALIDGAHGWPYVFIDLFYVHALVRRGGYVMFESAQVHSIDVPIRWLKEQPGYEVALDLGRSVIFRKNLSGSEFPEWNGQPYIVRLTSEDTSEKSSTAAAESEPAPANAAIMPGRAAALQIGAKRVRPPKSINGAASLVDEIDATTRSARIVVPLVMKLVREVRSVVQVGCGAGVWLAQFKELGASRVLGLDSSTAKNGHLEIEPEDFRLIDIESDIDPDERLDLCACLEIAASLSEGAAPTLVRNLCGLSDVILFSAAIPGQGGGDHSNERWPSYWADLFASAGYEAVDILRGRIWNDARVEWVYRQNLLFFANQAGLSRLNTSAALNGPGSPTIIRPTPLDIVHPACFEEYRQPFEQSLITAEPARPSSVLMYVPKKGVARYATRSYWSYRMAKLRRSIKKRL